VLLHGWAMSSAVFSEIADLLAADFRVVAPDLRGHGWSDPGGGYELDDFTADLGEWLRILDQPVDLFGWSFGGQVAMRLQQLEPGAVRRLGLISSTPRFAASAGWEAGLPDAQVLAMLRQIKRRYNKAMGDFFDLQFADEGMPKERYREIVDFALRQGRLPDPEVAVATLQTLRQGNLCQELPHLDCPTLVMHGEQDRICPAGAGRAMAEAIPKARLEIVSGVGHAPFLSKPQPVAACWTEFLS
nr:alpha/beta fold hydrolase [Desulfuromonadales bacterium]NIR34436.1 alpha/beta fold hydrolase [Desulfuromonadales bacterium]NIS42973.1 alpha/beta fold hydrolase [Desulfuromonadales bacterium]